MHHISLGSCLEPGFQPEVETTPLKPGWRIREKEKEKSSLFVPIRTTSWKKPLFTLLFRWSFHVVVEIFVHHGLVLVWQVSGQCFACKNHKILRAFFRDNFSTRLRQWNRISDPIDVQAFRLTQTLCLSACDGCAVHRFGDLSWLKQDGNCAAEHLLLWLCFLVC